MFIKRLLIALFLLLPANAFAADSTVTALTAASALGGTELFYCVQAGADRKCTAAQVGTYILTSPTITGTPIIPTPFTLGAISVTSTGTQLNLLSAATGTTGTTSTNIVFSTSPTLITPILGTATATTINGLGLTGTGTITGTSSTSVGRGQYQAINSATAATAGNIGEIVTNTVLQGAAVVLTTNVPADVTSVSLTAGNWVCSGSVWFNPAATTTSTYWEGWISVTSATRPTAPAGGMFQYIPQVASAAQAATTATVIPTAFSLSGTTTVFLSTRHGFAISTDGAFGVITCWRVN